MKLSEFVGYLISLLSSSPNGVLNFVGLSFLFIYFLHRVVLLYYLLVLTFKVKKLLEYIFRLGIIIFY